jgi:NADH-quinone oxidoreductase subunit H
VALAGWSSDNKFALLGGLRASAQLISYEVTLGLTLVGTFIAFGTLRLDEMVIAQGPLAAELARGGNDASLVFGWLPAWGIFLQPIGMVLFTVAAMAEIKRAPFDTPEGESEIIGYFVEYSGLKSGLFLIAEYVETVVVAGIITAIYLGGYHLPWIEPALGSALVSFSPANGLALLAVVQVFAFLVKTLVVIWFFFLVRWSFPRFRYDQIMTLGWKMILPLSLVNVMLAGFLLLWGGREAMAGVGLIELAGLFFLIWLSNRKPEAQDQNQGGHGHGSHGGHGDGGHGSHSGHGSHDAHAPAPHGAAPAAAASH